MNKQTQGSSTTQPPVRKRRWPRYTSVLLILVLIILVLLPYGIRYGMQRVLHESGAEDVAIDDVDFNLFTGKLMVDDLTINVSSTRKLHIPHISVNVSWWPLIQKRIIVQDIMVNDTVIIIEQGADGPLEIGGIALAGGDIEPVDQENNTGSWEFALTHLQIRNTELQYNSPQLNASLYIDNAVLSDMESWQQDEPARFVFDGRLNDSPLNIEADLRPFSKEPAISSNIKLASFSLAPFAAFAKPQVTALEGLLHMEIAVEAKQQGDVLTVSSQGELVLDRLEINSASGILNNQHSNWQGMIGIRMAVDEALHLQLEGNINSARISLRLPEPEKLSVFDLAAINIQDISVKGVEDISVTSIDMENISLLESLHEGRPRKGSVDDARVFHAPRMKLESISLNALSDLDIAAFTIQAPAMLVHRNAEGRLYLIDDLLAYMERAPIKNNNQAKQDKQITEAEKPEEKTPFTVQVSSMKMEDHGKLRFVDESARPAYRELFQLEDLQLTGLDTGQPQKAANYQLKGKIGKYSHVSLQGNILPLAPRLTMGLKGNIGSFELPPLSSYTANTLGYNLAAGTMNADINLNVQQGKIDGTSKLVINNIKLTPQDKEKMDQLATQLTMPLDAALSMLRDKKNDIHLKIPVSGDIADPEFSTADIINTALGKAMKTAAVGFLKNTLQPFGSLITVVQLTGKAAAHVSLDPVNYQPGKADLDEVSQQYLGLIVSLMNERPELRIRVCGVATESDRIALGVEVAEPSQPAQPSADSTVDAGVDALAVEQLQMLANERAGTVKDYLVSKHDISPERLFICHPEIDQDANALPHVKLLI